MKLRSGKVVRRSRSSPRIVTNENDVVEETCTRVTTTTSPFQGRRRSPRNLCSSTPDVDNAPSSNSHSMTLRSRKN